MGSAHRRAMRGSRLTRTSDCLSASAGHQAERLLKASGGSGLGHREGIGIIIPAYNAAGTIGATIDSLAGVGDRLEEIIVVDDGSSDETVAAAKSAAERIGTSLTVIHIAARGASAARNCGLDAVRAPLVYFIDADDIAIASGICRLADILDNDPALNLVVGAAIDRRQGVRRRHEQTPFSESPLENAQAYIRYRRPLIRTGSALGRRALLTSARFPEGVHYQEETVYWTSILARARPQAVADATMEYAVDEVRAATRILSGHRRKYLNLAQKIRALGALGLSRRSLRLGRGTNALNLARKLTRTRDYHAAREYLSLAWRAERGTRHRYAVAKAGVKLVLAKLLHGSDRQPTGAASSRK